MNTSVTFHVDANRHGYRRRSCQVISSNFVFKILKSEALSFQISKYDPVMRNSQKRMTEMEFSLRFECNRITDSYRQLVRLNAELKFPVVL